MLCYALQASAAGLYGHFEMLCSAITLCMYVWKTDNIRMFASRAAAPQIWVLPFIGKAGILTLCLKLYELLPLLLFYGLSCLLFCFQT